MLAQHHGQTWLLGVNGRPWSPRRPPGRLLGAATLPDSVIRNPKLMVCLLTRPAMGLGKPMLSQGLVQNVWVCEP